MTEDDWHEEDHGYDTPCWIRNGRRPTSYTQVKINGRDFNAHRIAWEQANGPIPPGLVIDHLCEQPACLNPVHMRVVSQAENVRRSAAAKLTHEQVAAIRADTRLQRVIAAEYGVLQQHISRIKRGERWA